jgi:Tfp pilus assembly protein PilX
MTQVTIPSPVMLAVPGRVRPYHSTPVRVARPSRGAVLVTSLIILTIMTIIGVNAMRAIVLEERMAGNLKEQAGAFQAAEAGVQAALTAIEQRDQPPRPDQWGAGSLFESCGMTDADDARACTLLEDTLADWTAVTEPTMGAALSSFGGTALTGVTDAKQPRVVVESRYVGLGEEENFEVAVQRRGVNLYTVTALGTGPGGQSEIILQATIPKVYDW